MRYFSEDKIREALKYSTASAMRHALNIILHNEADIMILPAESTNEEMYVMIRKKEDKEDGCK